MNRFLTCSFFLLLFLASCGTYRYPNASGIRESATQELNNYYIDTTQTFVYRAKLHAFKKEMNGSLMIKTLGRNEHRVALVSDFGQTLFDVSISPDGHELHYAMHDLNKRRVVREIVDIFRTMTTQRHATSAVMFANQQHYYPVYVVDNNYYVLKERKVERIQQAKGAKAYLAIVYQGWNAEDIPTSIAIEHKKYPITIDLALDVNQSIL
ncbi:hypothetical protein [Sphingobacterium corticibacterium]|uniref:Uncharacterized protein n=1 Tax=Sphingobacterium corticibacterium TaxID=2484746 RepID=A0A4Q6XUT3_9SPHI|nr:hypothetical protein [Sphingobacterium corticibacterium]RZF60136.1 hypothetical protein EWE74_13535 [Sphingobacterium corticibacterium]